VQFGMPYGIGEAHGQVRAREAGRILDAARRLGVDLLDTASAYGSSEEVLGGKLEAGDAFRIVTKTPPLGVTQVSVLDAARIRTGCAASLRRLRRRSVYGLLVHHCDELLLSGGELVFEQMQQLKRNSLVERIGVSVYTGAQIDAVLARYPIDIIQLPINILDQRLLRSGHLSRLRGAGVEIHARSAFLQGLLLLDPDRLPPRFASVRGHLARYHAFLREAGVSPVAAALGFLAALPEIDRVVVGVASAEQLEQAARAAAQPHLAASGLSQFALDDEAVLDPSRWDRNTGVATA
jgi:aryl-alcohol dehydrogenase-like predicted oxidoreductase